MGTYVQGYLMAIEDSENPDVSLLWIKREELWKYSIHKLNSY